MSVHISTQHADGVGIAKYIGIAVLIGVGMIAGCLTMHGQEVESVKNNQVTVDNTISLGSIYDAMAILPNNHAIPVKQPWATKRQWFEYATVMASELGDAYTTERCIHSGVCHENVLPLSIVNHAPLMYSYSALKGIGSIYLERKLLSTNISRQHRWFRRGIEMGQASHITMMVRQDRINWKAGSK